jgi:outer membrane murein-binding lipoprotein Lpp
MKTTHWFVLLAVALGAVGLALARADVANKTDAAAEVRMLRQQVEQLQARLKTPENRLAKVETARSSVAPRVQMLPQSPGSPPTLIAPPFSGLPGGSGPQPKLWGRREVNGWTAHFIPCGDE